MSTLLYAFLLLLAPTQTPMLPAAADLVAYYSFNQCDGRDDTGMGSDGLLRGQVGCWCGIEGDGLLFDGMDDWVEFSGRVNRYFTTTDFTVSFYIKPEGRAPYLQDLLCKRPSCTEVSMMDILLDPSGKKVRAMLYESPVNHFRELEGRLPASTWMHIALVREGQEARLYINGERQFESFRCRGVDLSNDMPLRFSNNPCSDTRPFKGVLDELRVYKRALNDEEMRLLYRLNPIENAVMDCVT